MKNYLAVYAADTSGPGGYQVQIGSTPAECQTNLDAYLAFDPTATVLHGPTRVFFLMNKNILMTYMAFIPTLLDPFHASAFTQDVEVAKAFGINADDWQGTDPDDPNQVKAAKIAKETTGNTKTMTPAILNMTVAQMIASSLVAVSQINRADYSACASDLKNLLNLLNSGAITASDALLAYKKITLKYPEIFL